MLVYTKPMSQEDRKTFDDDNKYGDVDDGNYEMVFDNEGMKLIHKCTTSLLYLSFPCFVLHIKLNKLFQNFIFRRTQAV